MFCQYVVVFGVYVVMFRTSRGAKDNGFVKTGMFCSTCFVSLDDVFRFAGRRVSSKSSVTVVKRNGDERFRKMKDE